MDTIESNETSDEITESQDDKPYVKVTTIKLLIQLLEELEYFGADHTLSKLWALSKTNCHIDVRLRIIKSVLSLPTLDS